MSSKNREHPRTFIIFSFYFSCFFFCITIDSKARFFWVFSLTLHPFALNPIFNSSSSVCFFFFVSFSLLRFPPPSFPSFWGAEMNPINHPLVWLHSVEMSSRSEFHSVEIAMDFKSLFIRSNDDNDNMSVGVDDAWEKFKKRKMNDGKREEELEVITRFAEIACVELHRCLRHHLVFHLEKFFCFFFV